MRKRFLYGGLGLIMALASISIARPVFAQGMVGQVVEILKEKIGFGYSPDSVAYIFEKDTPSYRAYSGTQAPVGGHRIMLERDGTSVDIAFLTAQLIGAPSDVLGQSTQVLTPDQKVLLDRAEVLLLTESSASAQGRQAVGDGVLTLQDRATIASASALLDSLSPVLGTASESAEPALSREAQDFALLLRLKSYKIDQLDLDVDLKLSAINRDLAAIMSKANLVEETTERVVTFHNLTMGADLNYRLNEAGIRQQIVLNDDKKLYSSFTFIIKKYGLVSSEIGEGVWYFRTLNGKNIMRLSKGWAKDANGKFTNNVGITLGTMRDIGDVMTITVSPEWLTAPERVFPITIESSLEIVPELREGAPGYTKPEYMLHPSATPVPTLVPATPTVLESTGSAAGIPSVTPTHAVTTLSPTITVSTQSAAPADTPIATGSSTPGP